MILSLLSFIAAIIFLLYIKLSKKYTPPRNTSSFTDVAHPIIDNVDECDTFAPGRNSLPALTTLSKIYELKYQLKIKKYEEEYEKKLTAQTAQLNSNIAQYKIRQKQTYDEYLKFKRYNNQHEIISKKYEELRSKEKYINKTYYDFKKLASSKESAYSYMSELLADYELIQYQNSIDYLSNKKRPALVEAMRIDDLKKQTKSYLVELNQLRYKIKELYSLFPDLEDYDDYEDSNPTPSDTSARIDDAIWFVLSDAEKNQIILNNYVNRHKTKWEIGRDYELYVGYKYQCLGYSVDYFGINNGINDLGRDLIISQNGEIGIVQCKYWSSKKQIHEKHIAQLYGTVVSYIIEHNYHPELVHGIFITNISLSETAKKFASYLDIKYKEYYEIGDFPRIKCNIGKDEYNMETKIYHLPTDQQYDSVKINQPGECFVFTTDEAEKLGFRRAFKWHSH